MPTIHAWIGHYEVRLSGYIPALNIIIVMEDGDGMFYVE